MNTLEKSFAIYGKPQYLMTDNGSWFVNKDKALTRVQMFLKDLGIGHIKTGVRRPTTKGFVERFHRTLNEELIKRFRFKDLEDAQKAFEAYRFYYNYQRPHQALGNLPPLAGQAISRYKFVIRQFPEPPVPIFYLQGSLLRKVRRNDCISFKGTEIYIVNLLIHTEMLRISEILKGIMVKIEQNKNCLEIYYDKNLIKSVTYVS